MKLQQLMAQDLFRTVPVGHVFRHVMHRFRARFVPSGAVILRQGDEITEASPIAILVNGNASVLLDPAFAVQREAASGGAGALQAPPCVSEDGCRCAFACSCAGWARQAQPRHASTQQCAG